MIWRRLFLIVKLLFIVSVTLILLAPEWPAFADEEYRLREIVKRREFDYLVWESDALFEKGEAILSGGHLFLNEQEKKQIVFDYLQLTRQALQLESAINQAFIDPEISDPDSATSDQQANLALIRQEIDSIQLLAEAVVQDQVALILREEGFEILDNAWPPVLMHVSPIPSLLVVSPRDRIEKKHQVSLATDLTTPEKELMETAVFDGLDLSALVVPLGGIGTFPAMINETSDINRLAEVTSHEWAHHWLTLRPLGFNYAFDPDVRIINETVASLIDQELGRRVVERFYPELLPLEVTGDVDITADPDPFDFRAELAATRVRSEELLAKGQIQEAEDYMEERRQLFVDHGYDIRKLNQAYFAFYGAYAADPGGAQGGSPIGPMLRDIRQYSPSIRAFMENVAPITSFEDLEEIHQRIVPEVS